MVSSTRQNNGKMFRKERAIQLRAAGDPAARVESTQPPRLTTTGDGPKRAGDRGGTREFQQFRSDPQPPRLTKAGDAHKAYCRRSTGQTEPPPATRASARAVPAPSARTKRVRIGRPGPIPGFRSASTVRKHRSNASPYLRQRCRLSSTRPTGLPSRRAGSCPSCARSQTRPRSRALHALHEYGACPQHFHGDPHRARAPQCPHSPKRGPNVEGGRSGRRQGRGSRTLGVSLRRHCSPPRGAPARRRRRFRPQCPLRVPLRRARVGRKSPSSHHQPPRRRRHRVTRQGRSASGGGASAPRHSGGGGVPGPFRHLHAPRSSGGFPHALDGRTVLGSWLLNLPVDGLAGVRIARIRGHRAPWKPPGCPSTSREGDHPLSVFAPSVLSRAVAVRAPEALQFLLSNQ